MTPISPKDRPKVIALAVLSVIMVGFFLTTILGAIKKPAVPPPPSGSPDPAQAAALAPGAVPGTPGALSAAVGPAGIPQNASPLPTRTVDGSGPSNPFRHVLPDPAEMQRMQAEANRPPAPKHSPPPLAGALPAPGAASQVAIAPVVPPAPMIRLEGVVSDRDRYAMVTYNDRTDMYHVGSRVGGTFTVIGVTDSGASFRGPKGVFRMDVGDERSATAPTGKDDSAPRASAATPKSAPRRGTSNELRRQEVAEYAMLPLPTIAVTGRGR